MKTVENKQNTSSAFKSLEINCNQILELAGKPGGFNVESTTKILGYTHIFYKQLLYKQVSTPQEKNLSNFSTG